MPVAPSMAMTNSAETPFFARSSQYQTLDWLVPMRVARAFWPPAADTARCNAWLAMNQEIPIYRLSSTEFWVVTDYQIFGRVM
jgi:hypothetical protein